MTDRRRQPEFVRLVLDSKLKSLTYSSIKSYLSLYSAECQGIGPSELHKKTRIVLSELKRRRRAREEHANSNKNHQQETLEVATKSQDDEYTHLYVPLISSLKKGQTFSTDDLNITPMFWQHPIPYLFTTTASYQAVMRRVSDETHPGEPEAKAFHDAPPLTFDYMATHVYDRRLEHFPEPEKFKHVVEVSRQLYKQNPVLLRPPSGVEPLYIRKKHGLECKQKSVAIIARTLLAAEKRFRSVLPVQFSLNAYNGKQFYIVPHFGLLITLDNGDMTLIPLVIWMLGGQNKSTTMWATKSIGCLAWLPQHPAMKDITEKFQCSPILRVEDVQLIQENQYLSTSSNVWINRRFSTTWDLAPVMSQFLTSVVRPASNSLIRQLTEEWSGWNRYTDLEMLARRILDVCKPVMFRHNIPTRPFQFVRPDSFDFVQPRILPELFKYRFQWPTNAAHIEDHGVARDEEYEDTHAAIDFLDQAVHTKEFPYCMKSFPVDGRASCAFHFWCTLLPQEGSSYCFWHHRIVMDARQCTQLKPPTPFSSTHIVLKKPQKKSWANALRLLHHISKNYIVWLVDVEFAVMPRWNAVPFQIVIRDAATGSIVLSTLVDYNSMLLKDMLEKMQEHLGRNNSFFPNQTILQGYYHSDRTSGFTLAAVGDAMRAANFNPDTHMILSWYSSIDMVAVGRALRGDNSLISAKDSTKYQHLLDSKGEDCFQPVNLGPLIKHCTNLPLGRLGFVHVTFCKAAPLIMHLPENDTLALYDVYHKFLEVSRGWVQG